MPGSLIIEVLPTIENALCLDGISDFGKATGLPVLKDYTVVADREIKKSTGGVVSKNTPNGAFVCDTVMVQQHRFQLITKEKYLINRNTSITEVLSD